MKTTLFATFDGEVLRPDRALPLAPNTRVLITIESEGRETVGIRSFLRTAQSLDLDSPADWSARLDEYRPSPRDA